MVKCSVWKEQVHSRNHLWYMETVEEESDNEGYNNLVFVDFECTQEFVYVYYNKLGINYIPVLIRCLCDVFFSIFI